MKQFINEIRTGKRHINKKITNAIRTIYLLSMCAFMFVMMLEVIGIDLIGFYK